MATIDLVAKHNPLAWLLYFTKLRVAVDGRESIMRWGRNEIPVTAGTHTVDISFGYMGQQRGQATTAVTVAEGQRVGMHYRMPSWMLAKGKIWIG